MLTSMIDTLYITVAIVISLTAHELGHAYMAYLMGDDTAKDAGRLTFNPLKHLDFFGTMMILFCGFGYAKPVPITQYKLRQPFKVTYSIVILSGVTANLILFVCSAIAFSVTEFNFFYLMIQMNVSLFFFNLIPVPPLDGFRLLELVVPESKSGFLYIMKRKQLMFMILAFIFWMLVGYYVTTPIIRSTLAYISFLLERIN